MGSWSVYCGISQIAITSGQECAILPLKKVSHSDTYLKNLPATLPIFGTYNDYGGIEGIIEDDNTKLIEEHFGITIDEFCTFLLDGKHTYNREEAREVKDKVSNLSELEDWNFMWIDKKVYDFMTINHDEHEKGYMDYGTPAMLKALGLEFVEKKDTFKNYDPKRFNQLWRKGDVEVFSDGTTILSKGGQYVYHFGKGNESSIETYFEVPEELQYLKDKTRTEAWKITKNGRVDLGWILGNSRYDDDSLSKLLEQMQNIVLLKEGKPIPTKEYKTLLSKYMRDLEIFGDRLAGLINVRHNLYPMSGQFLPHTIYITPQCGEYKHHQILLDKFAEINKSYIGEYYD